MTKERKHFSSQLALSPELSDQISMKVLILDGKTKEHSIGKETFEIGPYFTLNFIFTYISILLQP